MYRDAEAQSDTADAHEVAATQQIAAAREVAAWLTTPDRGDDG